MFVNAGRIRRRNDLHDIGIAVFERKNRGIGVRQDPEDDALQVGDAVVVVVVANDGDVVALHPFAEFERSAADDAGWIGAVAAAIDRPGGKRNRLPEMLRNDKDAGRTVLHERDESIVCRHFECVFIDNAVPGDVLAEQGGVAAAGVRIQRSIERERDVLRGDIDAVVPFGVTIQVEDVGQVIGRDFPVVGEAGNRLAIDR